MHDGWLVQCLSLAGDTSAGELAGAWLVSYDPEGCDGHGDALWTHDPAKATVFTSEEWLALSRAVPANRPPRSPGPEPAPDRPVSLADELRAMGLM